MADAPDPTQLLLDRMNKLEKSLKPSVGKRLARYVGRKFAWAGVIGAAVATWVVLPQDWKDSIKGSAATAGKEVATSAAKVVIETAVTGARGTKDALDQLPAPGPQDRKGTGIGTGRYDTLPSGENPGAEEAPTNVLKRAQSATVFPQKNIPDIERVLKDAGASGEAGVPAGETMDSIKGKLQRDYPDFVRVLNNASAPVNRAIVREGFSSQMAVANRKIAVGAILDNQKNPTLVLDLNCFTGAGSENFKVSMTSSRGTQPLDAKNIGKGIYLVKDPMLNGTLDVTREDGTPVAKLRLDDKQFTSRHNFYDALRRNLGKAADASPLQPKAGKVAALGSPSPMG